MSIWSYDSSSKDPRLFWTDNCPFCKEQLECVYTKDHDLGKYKFRNFISISNNTTGTKYLYICRYCGWWKAADHGETEGIHPQDNGTWIRGAVGSLKELDLSDINAPILEVRDYLTAKFDSRFAMNPRLFEETVASVFSSLGFKTTVTAYSNDGGIDVLLYHNDTQVGVQVKRYKNKINVEQIRSFCGALVLKGITNGIFITTSSFQSGASSTTKQLETRGYKIELLDSQRFYDSLKIAQKKLDRESIRENPSAYFYNVELIMDVNALSFRM